MIIFLPLHDVFPLRILVVVVEEDEEEHERVVPDIVIISVSLSLSNTFFFSRPRAKEERRAAMILDTRVSPMKKKFDPSVCRVERGDKQRKLLGFNPKLIFLHLKKKIKNDT